jgi:hypothetical protein
MSSTRPPSGIASPAMLWPPPLTASVRPCSPAKRTQARTSSLPSGRAIAAGRRSIMAFHTVRASS